MKPVRKITAGNEDSASDVKQKVALSVLDTRRARS